MKIILLFSAILACAQASGQWTSTNLSEGKVQMGAVAYGSKAYFGGGFNGSEPTKLVEIYDPASGEWTSEELSAARSFPAAAAGGGKVFFAGGIKFNGLIHYEAVDIFDTLTQQWSVAALSSGRMYIQAAAVGEQVLFAGGYKILAFSTPPVYEFTNVVDVYDLSTGTWSVQALSEARAGMAVAVVGELAFFAGGQTGALTVSKRVDIFNAQTSTWTTDSLSEARTLLTATTIGSKVLFAGGVTNDNLQSGRVDIFDTSTGVWTTSDLSEGRSFTTMSASACGKAFFAAGGTLDLSNFSFTSSSNAVDVYDPATDTWTTDFLQKSVINHTVLGLQNQVLVAGGFDFVHPSFKTVEIFTCEEPNAAEESAFSKGFVPWFSNPVSDMLYLNSESVQRGPVSVTLTNLEGQTVFFEKSLAASFDISHLPAGIYFLQVRTSDLVQVGKLVKQQ